MCRNRMHLFEFFSRSHRCQALLIGLIFAFLFTAPTGAWAKKVYVWRDKDGKVHFSDQRPHPTKVQGEIGEKGFKEWPSASEENHGSPRSPIEHAVLCTFRLSNKRGGASGFFINERGIAVTAKHVVKGVTYSMKAELPGDKRKYSVRVLRKSRKHDLAILKILVDRPTPYLEIRGTETLIRGEELYAIGNPLIVFKETVTKGIFSRIFPEKDFKKELKIKPPFKGDWIQFSAAIIGGNSGGPLVDKDGKLVGVVSLGLKNYGAVNFAVPSAYILKDFKSFLE